MHVLQLVHVERDPDGGSAGVTHELAEAWRKRGVDVIDLYADDLTRARGRRLRGELLPIAAAVAGRTLINRIDVVYATGHLGWVLFPLLRARGSERPVMVAASFGLEHEQSASEDRPETRSFPAYLRHKLSGVSRLPEVARTVAAADGFVALTRFSAEYASRRGWVSPEHTLVTGCGLPPEVGDLKIVRDPARDWQGRVAWCGTAIDRKGWGSFVAAMAKLREPIVKDLLILGTHIPSDDLIQQLRKAGVTANIHAYPKLDRAQQLSLLASADAFVSTSLYEGFHRALLEVMALGVPCIATLTGFVRDHEKPNSIARIIPFSQPASVADAICEMATDGAARQRIASAGRLHALSFQWEVIADRQLAWFHELSAMRSKGLTGML